MNITLLNPSALWMLTALAIPLIIHLLHRGQRERVLVGSIRFLKGRETQTLSRLKLTEKRLLLLRLLLFTLLALLLARPHLRLASANQAPPGWLLMDPRLANRDLPAEQAQVLQRAEAQNWRISWLAKGFPAADQTPPGNLAIQPGELWSLAAEAAMVFPDDHAMAVITLDRMRDFQNTKPFVQQAKLRWYLVPDLAEDPVLEYGYLVAPDRLLLVTGQRIDGEWVRSRHTLPWSGDTQTHQIEIPNDNGKTTRQTVSLQMDSGNVLAMAVGGESRPLAVAGQVANPKLFLVTADPDAQDAAYLRLGLNTVAEHYQWPLEIQVVSPSDLPGDAPAMAFWLGIDETDPPREWYAAGTWVFRDAGQARFETGGQSIDWRGNLPGAPAKLSRRIPPNMDGEVLWVDAWNQPVLQMRQIESGREYRFYSRFLPAWSDLVFHEAFPVMLAQMLEARWLMGQPNRNAPITGPAISMDQAEPLLVDGQLAAPEVSMTNLAGPVWLAMMLVFLAERWWRSRRQVL